MRTNAVCSMRSTEATYRFRHSGIKFVSPSARHEGLERQMLYRRQEHIRAGTPPPPESVVQRNTELVCRGTSGAHPQRGKQRVGVKESEHEASLDYAG